MPRKGQRDVMLEGLNMPTKIRKRGCSSSPTSSSRVYNYRFNKRAILVGKNRAGLVRSRSSTPVPIWRTTPLRSAIDTPKYSQSGKSARPISARRLAATLWEMNEMPSPEMSEINSEAMKRHHKKSGSRMMTPRGERLMHPGSGFLPAHLSDPPHSPTVSEKMDRSGTGSRQRQTPSISQKLMSIHRNFRATDSISDASFMEIETRSRPQISSESVIGGSKNRLKDVSSALTTSKELLKIVNRIWAQADQPSSSTSLISALHAELERARLQVNQLIHEQRSECNEINYLMKCYAEEKASWKNNEHLAVEAAIGSVARELEVERKLRHRLESLNAKLGKEVAEMKSSLVKAVEELESERRARELTEQVSNELARNIDEDRAEVEKLKRASLRVHEDVEKEREVLELVDKLHEERAQMKLSEAKHQFEEKNSAIGKLRKQLEVFLGPKRDKDEDRATHLSKPHQRDDEELDDGVDSGESDLHSIEIDLSNKKKTTDKGANWGYTKARNSISQRSTHLQRSVSDGVEWAGQGAGKQRLDEEGFDDGDNEVLRSSYLEEIQRLKPGKGLKKNHVSRVGRENHIPYANKEHSLPPRDPYSLSKSRATEGSRRSKW